MLKTNFDKNETFETCPKRLILRKRYKIIVIFCILWLNNYRYFYLQNLFKIIVLFYSQFNYNFYLILNPTKNKEKEEYAQIGRDVTTEQLCRNRFKERVEKRQLAPCYDSGNVIYKKRSISELHGDWAGLEQLEHHSMQTTTHYGNNGAGYHACFVISSLNLRH